MTAIHRQSPGQVRETLDDLEALFDRLWPLLRSLSGAGVRATHDILNELVPLERIEVPSGTRAFDWTVPKEWIVREAYVQAPDGSRVADVADNNLHLINYAAPFRGTISRAELDRHLHSRPDLPDAIPYVTSYYEPRWGFCLNERRRRALPEGNYEIVVDTNLVDGSMTLSEAVLSGEESAEVLISTYTCHPSLANNELSGPIAAAFLYRRLAAWPERRLTYRFVFAPETIGALAYLSMRGDLLRQRLAAGYVVTCVGLDTHFTYKRSREGDSLADRAAAYALKHLSGAYELRDFSPVGSDERQYCSPGFNLPVGSLMRGVYGEYPEYHTSLDNKSLISFEALQGSIDAYESICRVLDQNLTFKSLYPYGEPQLGRRGLYPTLSTADQRRHVEALMWVLNMADGDNDLLSIAERSGLALEQLWQAGCLAEDKGLLQRQEPLTA
jgi:aminopeptidase-like protein